VTVPLVGITRNTDFHREFTAGNLAGLGHEDELGFCRLADAQEWVRVINEKNAAGKLDYKVTAFSIKW